MKQFSFAWYMRIEYIFLGEGQVAVFDARVQMMLSM
jgi:hypothetical protein